MDNLNLKKFITITNRQARSFKYIGGERCLTLKNRSERSTILETGRNLQSLRGMLLGLGDGAAVAQIGPICWIRRMKGARAGDPRRRGRNSAFPASAIQHPVGLSGDLSISGSTKPGGP